MSLTLVKIANFGKSKGGLADVGYVTYTAGGTASARTGSVSEIGTNTGIYGCNITFADGWKGTILWDSGEGTPVYAAEEYQDLLDTAFVDGDTLTTNGLKERLRMLGWLVRNRMVVANDNGNLVLYEDDGTTVAFSVNGALTDDTVNTERLRIE